MIRVSVVATGMDGASIAAIEPYQRRRDARAPEHAEPVWQEAEAPDRRRARADGAPIAPEPVAARIPGPP